MLASDVTATVQAPGNRITQFSVNEWGEPMTTHDPSGRRTVISYGNNSGKNPVSVVHDDWSEDRFAYDAFDRDTMVQMAGDSATYYHYNGASQVDSVWGQAAVATGYHYNPDNTLASTTDATGVTVTYTYNSGKEVTSATDNMAHQTYLRLRRRLHEPEHRDSSRAADDDICYRCVWP